MLFYLFMLLIFLASPSHPFSHFTYYLLFHYISFLSFFFVFVFSFSTSKITLAGAFFVKCACSLDLVFVLLSFLCLPFSSLSCPPFLFSSPPFIFIKALVSLFLLFPFGSVSIIYYILFIVFYFILFQRTAHYTPFTLLQPPYTPPPP